jgi:mediator of RNA polymerase II transcription subunit 12
MTSKPSVGIQRQPQRPSSGAGIQQIPVPQRSLSQQYSLSSTVRRVEGSTGLGIEVPEVASYGRATLGGPRLRTDTLNVSTATPDLADGWDATTTVPEPRGRPPLHRHPRAVQRRPPGSQDTSHLRSILGVQKTASSVPVPLPRRPLQTTSPAPNRSIDQPVAAGVKKESRPKPYVLEAPTVAPRLQSNGKLFPLETSHPNQLTSNR